MFAALTSSKATPKPATTPVDSPRSSRAEYNSDPDAEADSISFVDETNNINYYDFEEVGSHNTRKDLWIIIAGKVYDVTQFQKDHPGGAAALLQYGGQDATKAAAEAHKNSQSPAKFMESLCIGEVGADSASQLAHEQGSKAKPNGLFLDLAALQKPTTNDKRRNLSVMINTVPVMHAMPEGKLNTVPPSPPDKETVTAPGSVQSDAEEMVSEPTVSATKTNVTICGSNDINVHSLGELQILHSVAVETANVWETFCTTQGSPEAASEAIFNALFESAPSLQQLFTTPRTIQAMKFLSAIHNLVQNLSKPQHLRSIVETLAFSHLSFDVTVSRVILFRDAIIELFEIDLGELFSSSAREGWKTLLNYVGGAIIYIKMYYRERLQILEDSWAKAVDPEYHSNTDKQEEHISEGSGKQASGEKIMLETKERKGWKSKSMANLKSLKTNFFTSRAEGRDTSDCNGEAGNNVMTNAGEIVRTFRSMFEFNSAIMGCNKHLWLQEVVNSFDNIVVNIANNVRLQEECDVLVIKISVTSPKGDINLSEFKSCTLASLRSLLPQEWDSAHEVAWDWLWENVERMLKKNLGKPAIWKLALGKLMDKFDDATGFEFREKLYQRFFKLAPAGQEHFKQSDTRLHFIAEQIMLMTVDLFDNPHRMTSDISALGLRHVGYGIPTDLFGPFVSAAGDVMKKYTDDDVALEAFKWSLSLIAKMLVRTITEGSTIVMKAIHANSLPQLRKALTCAPRGKRACWLLSVEVGTESISPLMWAIESGRLEAAQAIIRDLLVIRADRDAYYYGVEDLFRRHEDIVKRLIQDAISILPELLHGLVWRARATQGGLRRVNYYVKHLVCAPDGGISETLTWMVAAKVPKIMSDEVIVLVSDTMWNGLVCRQFTKSKIWFMISLLFFMLSQAILPRTENADDFVIRIAVCLARLTMYILTMTRLMYMHAKFCLRAFRENDTFVWCKCIKVPSYLKDPRDSAGFMLVMLLAMMCVTEPMFHCLTDGDREFPAYTCPQAVYVQWWYSVFCMGAMAIHWLLLIDLSVFSTGLSAFVLVIGQVLSEMTRFLITLVWLLLTFGSAISVLEHGYFEMRNIPNTVIALFAITLRLYEDDYRNMLEIDGWLLLAVFIFVTISVVVLLNLLIAQINCSYVFIYQDMVGFARLNRVDVICETLEKAPPELWSRFVETLKLDAPLEFNEGDVGVPGGIQVLESASVHPVTVDSIQRYGGSCAKDMPWPEDLQTFEDEDKCKRMQKGLKKVLRRIGKAPGAKQSTVNRNMTSWVDHSHKENRFGDNDSSDSCQSSLASVF